jgi:hypothetical protein
MVVVVVQTTDEEEVVVVVEVESIIRDHYRRHVKSSRARANAS